jgi:hypothetical protein
MNRNKKIVVVSAFGLVAVMLTTGWGVLAGAGWPPEPYQEYSRAGSWTIASPDHPVFVFSPRDPEGMSSVIVVGVTLDPTFGGAFPEATDTGLACGTAVRIGPNTDQIKVVRHAIKAGTPRPTIQGIVVVEETTTLTGPDEMEFHDVTASLYSAAADQDGDGLPDVGEEPLMVVPLTALSYAKRI